MLDINVKATSPSGKPNELRPAFFPERRRPGRVENPSEHLIPLLRREFALDEPNDFVIGYKATPIPRSAMLFIIVFNAAAWGIGIHAFVSCFS